MEEGLERGMGSLAWECDHGLGGGLLGKVMEKKMVDDGYINDD